MLQRLEFHYFYDVSCIIFISFGGPVNPPSLLISFIFFYYS